MCDMYFMNVVSNVVIYNTIINGLCKKASLEKAHKVVRNMVGKMFNHDIITYNTLMDELCKK